MTRYYYSDAKLFEKSLDVYIPAVADPNMPIVLLVVGSGWMGHVRSIYAMTSWWNSSGPKTIASCGAVCVCIRHRGTFFKVPTVTDMLSTTHWYYLIMLLPLFIAAMGWKIVVATILWIGSLWWCMAAQSQGSAGIDDMVDDVAEAIAWVHRNKDKLCETNATDTPLIFGGYSSGGHVAACLLLQQEVWKQHGLPDPTDLFAGILLISGVLAVQPCVVEIPSVDNDNDAAAAETTTTIAVGQNKPRLLTDLVMRMVWGPSWAETIPSPVQHPTKPPDIPHLLIGNRHEMFGLTWLDVLFCSHAYAEKLRRMGLTAVTYQAVPSDHWNILNSRVLRDTLRDGLPALVAASSSSSLSSQQSSSSVSSQQ